MLQAYLTKALPPSVQAELPNYFPLPPDHKGLTDKLLDGVVLGCVSF